MKTNPALKTVCSKLLTPFALAVAAGIGLSGTVAQALTFNFNYAPVIDPQALAGFQAAGNLWSSVFTDDVTINIDIGFEALDPGILGQTGSSTVGFLYPDVRNALIGDRTSADDATAVANLPDGPFLDFLTTNKNGQLIIDANHTANNILLDVNTANAKALGLLADDGSADAGITFSSNFGFDFDPTNGIDAGAFDFVGVAAHEIGHALGFVSGVDIVDLTSKPNGPFAPFNLDPFKVFSVLDLYRYSKLSVLAGNIILGKSIPDWAVGRTPYFSIDGGATNLGLFSTGAFNGDGNQASHWKDNLGFGIMDPTAAPGEFLKLTSLDLQAFDVMGWDLAKDKTSVPEPSSLIGLTVLGAGILLTRNKRRVFKTNS